MADRKQRILERLDRVNDRVIAAEQLRAELVGKARWAGANWDEIGFALGVSKQAAWRRYRIQLEYVEEATS